jgi:hypothetical protein
MSAKAIVANFPYKKIVPTEPTGADQTIDPKVVWIEISDKDGQNKRLSYCADVVQGAGCQYGVNCRYSHPYEYEQDPSLAIRMDILISMMGTVMVYNDRSRSYGRDRGRGSHRYRRSSHRSENRSSDRQEDNNVEIKTNKKLQKKEEGEKILTREGKITMNRLEGPLNVWFCWFDGDDVK